MVGGKRGVCEGRSGSGLLGKERFRSPGTLALGDVKSVVTSQVRWARCCHVRAQFVTREDSSPRSHHTLPLCFSLPITASRHLSLLSPSFPRTCRLRPLRSCTLCTVTRLFRETHLTIPWTGRLRTLRSRPRRSCS
eukprot:1165895-Rhodomonas_salina.4